MHPDEIRNVAELLCCDLTEIYLEDWDVLEHSRSRSAISRAYYHCFHVVKSRLIYETSDFPNGFPQWGMHRTIRSALDAVFTGRGPLTSNFRGLLDAREQADYELHLKDFDTSVAEDWCEAADRFVERFSALPLDKIEKLAGYVSGRVPFPPGR